MNLNEHVDMVQRDCYYIYRAMHDATCPMCGFSSNNFEMPDGTLECGHCEFHMTVPEQEEIQDNAAPVLQRRIESFMKFRDNKHPVPVDFSSLEKPAA